MIGQPVFLPNRGKIGSVEMDVVYWQLVLREKGVHQ